jgi:inorganic pyrophosphatase
MEAAQTVKGSGGSPRRSKWSRKLASFSTRIAIAALAALLVSVTGPAVADSGDEPVLEIRGERNLLHGFPAANADGTINVVIECPAGTTAKWQVEPDGVLRRQYQDGELYDLDYLPFLVNYGMIPRTLALKEVGGEGEQLDVQVLGNVIERGTVVRARVIGALALMDSGKQDDKLVAVVEGTPIGEVRSMAELDEKYPGISTILETWWLHFKGPVMKSFGYLETAAAARLIDAASQGYEKQSP